MLLLNQFEWNASSVTQVHCDISSSIHQHILTLIL